MKFLATTRTSKPFRTEHRHALWQTQAYLNSTGVCPSITLFAIIVAVDRGTSRTAFARTQLNHPEMTLGCFPNASSATRTTFSAGSP